MSQFCDLLKLFDSNFSNLLNKTILALTLVRAYSSCTMSLSPESMPRPPHASLDNSPERQAESAVLAKDVVAILVVVGFDTLRDSPKPPSEVLADFASALQAYEVQRPAGSSNDVAQRPSGDNERASESDFLPRAFEVMETARAHGVNFRAVMAQLLTQSARFTDIEREITGGAEFHGGHAEQVWRQGAQEVLPQTIEG